MNKGKKGGKGVKIKKGRKEEIENLHKIHGDTSLSPIYGYGCTKNPRAMFIFMNPTAKNVSADKKWTGIRAPWIGTKTVWKLFFETGFISKQTHKKIKTMRAYEWNPSFAKKIYEEVSKNSGYITNLAKCTQLDARPLHNKIFEDYLDNTKKEIKKINPKSIFTFGNQVSSIILGQPTSVSTYNKTKEERLIIKNKTFRVYPTHYPVGQGMRNMPIAICRIKKILQKQLTS